MKHVLLHCKDVGKSREFVASTDNYTVIDWMDLDLRAQVIELFNLYDQNVLDFPSVVLPYPAWFKPTEFYGDQINQFDAGYEVFYFEENNDKLEDRVRFLQKRSKGYISGIEVPDVDYVVWGSYPEPVYGYRTLFDGWHVENGIATRKFKLEESPTPTKPPVEVIGEE